MSNLKAEYGAMEYKDNSVFLNLNAYKGKAYIPVRKVVDLATARVLSKDKLRSMNNSTDKNGIIKDVYVKHSSGEVEFITRQELATNYKLLSGKNIILLKIKNNKAFYIKRSCNLEYRAMLLPPGFVNTFNGKVINGKAYAVVPFNNSNSNSENLSADESENNGLDLSKLTIMSSELFKKSFVIPDNELIYNARQKAANTNGRFNLSRFIENKKNNSINRKKAINKRKSINLLKSDTNKTKLEQPANIKDTIQQENNNKLNLIKTNNMNNSEQESKFKFKAEARLFNVNNTLIGFMLVDKKGTRLPKDLATVSKLASLKLISNLSLVNSEDKTFLRGNGIRIEDLPILKSR